MKVYAISCQAVVDFVQALRTSSSKPLAPVKVIEAPSQDERELNSKGAFAYIHRRTKKSPLNTTTFGFYLTYDIIPSRLVKGERLVQVKELDAYLELAPDGVYANHISHPVGTVRKDQDLSTREAYDYYREVDPKPVSLVTFRHLVAAGVVAVIRTANNPKAAILGFRRQDINEFLALRQRIQEKALDKPKSPPAALLDTVENISRAFEVELARAQAKKEALVQEETTLTSTVEPRWLSTKEAYVYYEQRSTRPYTYSWFRDKVYRSDLFRTRTETGEHVRNPTGKLTFVDLNSVDEYLTTGVVPKSKPQKAWPVEKAYYKFSHAIPDTVSLLDFKKLVSNDEIKSYTRSTVVYVKLDALEQHFGEAPDLPQQDLEEVPTEAPRAAAPPQEESSSEKDPAPPVGIVSLSLSDYESLVEMKKTLDLLTSQGFQVEVKP